MPQLINQELVGIQEDEEVALDETEMVEATRLDSAKRAEVVEEAFLEVALIEVVDALLHAAIEETDPQEVEELPVDHIFQPVDYSTQSQEKSEALVDNSKR
jgi:hypothetical protein